LSAEARIAVLGAGSVGCFIGGAWQAAGLPITFIGRPAIAQAIDRHGLTLSDYAGWRAHLKPGEVDYRCGPEALGDAQVILVTVKSGATPDAAAQIAAHARDGATVISFQNGISNIETLERALGGRFEIARGMVGFNIAYLGDGQFHKGVAGHLWADRCDATIMLADSLREGPAALTLSSNMLGLAWGKLLINMNNAVNALSGRSLWDELHNRNYRRLFAASILEGLRILRRAEIAPAKVGPLPPLLLARVLASPDWLFNTLFFRTWKIDRKARSSMADDIAEGRRTEVNYINGELIRLAERLGMHAPVNRAIVELIRRAESGARPLEPMALRKAVLGR
jgi:2-dehydropantoate 2-reductase